MNENAREKDDDAAHERANEVGALPQDRGMIPDSTLMQLVGPSGFERSLDAWVRVPRGRHVR